MGERVLGEVVQHVALILSRVTRPQKLPAPGRLVPAAPGVVSRGHVIEPQLAPALLQRLEFQEPVAGDAGVGRAALEIGPAERVHHRRIETIAQIEGIVGNAETPAHCPRIFHIARRPTRRPFAFPGVAQNLATA